MKSFCIFLSVVLKRSLFVQSGSPGNRKVAGSIERERERERERGGERERPCLGVVPPLGGSSGCCRMGGAGLGRRRD